MVSDPICFSICYPICSRECLTPFALRNIANYAIDNFSFNSEVSGDAEIGLKLGQYTLQIYAR